MRGLPFPSDALNREGSHEYASPTPTLTFPDIPFDPQLASPLVGPVHHPNGRNIPPQLQVCIISLRRCLGYLSFRFSHVPLFRRVASRFVCGTKCLETRTNHLLYQPVDHMSPISPASTETFRQYPQGPQGDPFAPQPESIFFRKEDDFQQQQRQQLHPTKPLKKKRRIRREEECGFCRGDDNKNAQGEPELLVTCSECGRSGELSTLACKTELSVLL